MKAKDVPITNLQILAPSRKAPKAGDIFVCRPAGRGYIFGRVVRTDAKMRYMADSNLIYLFAGESESKIPPDRLSAMSLLVPPLMTNRLPWSRGYFETIDNRTFEAGEKLPAHCFKEPGREPVRYWDDSLHELPKKIEPCGLYALWSYRTIDDAVSDALGIPRAPD